MYQKTKSIPFIMLLLLTSCFNKQGVGTLAGGAAGAIIGTKLGNNSLLGTGIGAVVGSMIGGQIGKQLDERDQIAISRSSQQALEYGASGQAVEWNNPDSGNNGYIIPKKAYRDTSHNRYCREFTQVVSIGGEKSKAYGTACRMPDGSWKIES